MSDPEPVDLSDLQFMPDWLKGGGERKPAHDKPSSDRSKKPPRDRGPQKGRGKGKGGPKGRGGNYSDKRGGGRRGDQRRDGRGRGREQRPKPAAPPKGISASLVPGEVGIRQIAEQIKQTARAYPVFDIARLVLAARDRYTILFKRDNAEAAELFVCKPDRSAWLSRAEATAHLPQTEAFAEHYDEESVEGDPPKGNYTAIAVCGFSGKLIGPPNHHSYQSEIARLHRQRFSNMPIEKYKSRIRVEHDEEVIDRWKTEQSVQRHYTYLKAAEGDEPLKFDSREAAERHFVENHGGDLVAASDEVAVSGDIGGKQLSPGLLTLLREVADNARKHPASLVQPLCGLLGAEGLKFFKRGRKIFAALTRPKPLSEDSGLSGPILAIVELLRRNRRTTVEEILAELAPSDQQADGGGTTAAADSPAETSTAETSEPAAEAAADAAPAETGEQPASEADDQAPADTEQTEDGAKPAEAAAQPELNKEQIKVLQDLRWLLHEGAVIAFGDGHIELATPRPPKKQPKGNGGEPSKPKTQETHPVATPPKAEVAEEVTPAREEAAKEEAPPQR